jgi:PAS domain S-box-containing protein
MALATRLLLLVALAVAPALLIVGYNQLELRRTREAEIRLAAERHVNDATSEVRSLVEGVQRLSAVVAKLPEVVTAAQGSGFSEPCSRLLVAIRQDSPGRLDYGIANRDGRVVCTTGGTSAVRTVEGDHLRRAIASNAFVVGTFAEVRELNRRYLSFAHPVRDASGAAVGAVVTGVDLAWLAEELRNRLRVPQAVLSVHDRNLVYLLRVPDEAGLVGKPPPPSVQALSRFANQGAIDAEGADGIRRVGAINTLRFSPDALPTGDVSVAFGLAAHTAFSDVNAATYRGLALLGMSIVLAALAAMYGGRRFIGEPVSELLAAAKRWRGGDYKARVGVAERSSELGHLATAYEEMADALAEREEERTRAEAHLRASEERLRLSQDAGGIGLWDWDLASQKIVWSESLRQLWGMPAGIEPSFAVFLDHVHPEDREKTEEHTRGVLRGQHPFDIELRTNEAKGPMRWIAAKGELISDSETGRALRMIGTCQDITERKRAEEQQRLLINELNHRVKNTLATVQAIAFQSLKSGAAEGSTERFEQRLLALSKTHDVLTRDNWGSTSVHAVVSETIAPYSGGGAERFSVAGESVRVPPNIVVPLSMAMHELCTNAAKYGALSVPTGRVSIGWRLTEKEGAQRLVIDWRESGGPAVSEPPVRGFGTRLIERSLARQLAGDVHLQFHCDGVRCRIDVPLKPAGGTAPARPAAEHA